jgi:hypothetical protein
MRDEEMIELKKNWARIAIAGIIVEHCAHLLAFRSTADRVRDGEYATSHRAAEGIER